jgi:uncharacterized membrane protein YcaP (DUF421 family)
MGFRLMGKRQIGEFQPFEFIITLMIAELASVPMTDISIPIIYGLVPIFVIFVMHHAITLIGNKWQGFRKTVNGSPQIVINADGIDSAMLKKLNMNVNDLLEAIRGQGYFSIEEVKYAIVETNGKVSVLPNSDANPPSGIPITLIVNSQYIEDNFALANVDKNAVESILAKSNLTLKNVLLMSKKDNGFFLQPYGEKYFTIGG